MGRLEEKIKSLFLLGTSMAKMYRETVTTLNKTLVLPADRLFTISPIDADQIPNGYLKSVKVSISPLGRSDTELSFIVVASTNDAAGDSDDWITAGATPRGGGTIWLNLKRPVKSSAEEPNRPDGEVYIHVITQGVSPATPVELNVVGECWGRFLNMEAV